MRSSLNNRRVLAIDPCPGGFGYAVLEGPEVLIDWGIKQTEVKKEQDIRLLRFVEGLMKHYEPDAVVIEDYEARGCRRGRRAGELARKVADLAAKREIRTVQISRLAAKKTFGTPNKHEMAKAIAERFPELEPRLFPYRRTWMPEDHRTPLFDAVGFGIVFLERRSKQKRDA